MEVHHHSHTPRKKWHHYFWEFLMLFLAVTLGFFVENQREHLIEHKREKVFMNSLVEDIKADTATYRSMITIYTTVKQHVDSLIILLADLNNLERNAKAIYSHQVFLQDYSKLIYSDRTIQQLKNGGNFRLIRKKEVSDKIIAYDGLVRNMVEDMQQQLILTRHLKINDGGNSIFKFGPMRHWNEKGRISNEIMLPDPPYFITPTNEKVDHLINDLELYSLAIGWFVRHLQQITTAANELNGLIKKEYN